MCMSRVYGQAPEIEWQKTIGGSGYDWLKCSQITFDGGIILAGNSSSGISGDKTEDTIGGWDVWVIKLDSNYNIEWQNTIGGDQGEGIEGLQQTIDGGYILGCISNSDISGDKTENHLGGADSLGNYYDYWVVKLDPEGNIEWENTIGGWEDDFLYSISQTDDHGFIVGGHSESYVSGDKTESSISGSPDYWVIKLDSVGNIIWQNNIGGTSLDYLCSTKQTADGGYILGGYSASGISGDKTEASLGSYDLWIIKLDSSGNIEWQNTIGGSNWDYLTSIELTNGNGYVISVYSYFGISGDKTEENFGFEDYWVVKLDSLGNIEWQNTIGGTERDNLKSIQNTSDGGFILGGYSNSGITGDKIENNYTGADVYGNNYYDYWIIKLDSTGLIEWQNTLGGSESDLGWFAQQTPEGNYLISGWSYSGASVDKTEEGIGDRDFWIIKLFPDCTFNTEICNDIDDDCNGFIDDALPLFTLYADNDHDTFGNSDFDTLTCYATAPGYSSDSTDCNDANFLINPGANEFCNHLDDNCNILIDDDLPQFILYYDQDGDHFGNVLIDTSTCFFDLANYQSDSTDCDDTNPLVYPGAPEILDGLDNDCNQIVDEGVGIDGLEGENGISIYPNPANDKIILSINTQFNINSSSNITICDLSGKNILQMIIKSGETEIDVSEFINGFYFVKVVIDGSKFMHKLIVE